MRSKHGKMAAGRLQTPFVGADLLQAAGQPSPWAVRLLKVSLAVLALALILLLVSLL